MKATVLVCLLVVTASSYAQKPVSPSLPLATVDLSMPAQTGKLWSVPPGDSKTFQNDVNGATCGDTIVLTAGSTYAGNFTAPDKSCKGWIVVESSQVSQLPSGTRVGPSNVPSMATISTNTPGMPALQFQPGAHNWRLIGLEVTTTIGMMQYALIETDVSATSLSQLPSYVIVDRCYVHADRSASVRRGLSLNVAYGAVVDSYFSEFHQPGYDSQAILGWNGPGPLLIQNNFLSAASENLAFGGSDPGIANLVPSDITIVGNHFWKNYASWAGAGLNVKNLLEFKNAQRILVDGNILEYSWVDGQVGFAILITPRNQNGNCDWCVVQDLTITHNLIQHASSGIESATSDYTHVSLPTNRVLIQNNILADISSAHWGGSGQAFLFLSVTNGPAITNENNLTVDHNTTFSDQTMATLAGSGAISSFQFTNNLGNYGQYGIIGTGAGPGSATLNAFVPTALFNDVVMLTANGNRDGLPWPNGVFWNTDAGAQFTNFGQGNYQLLSASPYHSAGTDGKDIGVWDWGAFNMDTSNASEGVSVPRPAPPASLTARVQ